MLTPGRHRVRRVHVSQQDGLPVPAVQGRRRRAILNQRREAYQRHLETRRCAGRIRRPPVAAAGFSDGRRLPENLGRDPVRPVAWRTGLPPVPRLRRQARQQPAAHKRSAACGFNNDDDLRRNGDYIA